MNRHALSVLEFERVLALVADEASSAPGAQRVRELRPHPDRGAAERELVRVTAMRALLEAERPFRPEALPDLRQALGRLRLDGATLDGRELLDASILLRSSRLTRAALTDSERPAAARAVLAADAEALIALQPLEDRIGGAIADDAAVKDDASPTLRRLRRELRGAEAELVRLLERVLRSIDPQHQAPDLSVTMRNGRYVIPVRREGHRAVGGIVHDSSGSGATLFVEPPAAIEYGNRIRELELEEQAEVERVLAELTDALRPHVDGMRAAWETLVTLDALYARSRWSLAHRCAIPDLSDPADGFVVREGRHPLLVAQGIPVVPLDLSLDAGERTLLVSGPNTGGKTVLLKAIGLFSAMVAAGIPPTVGEGSRLAIYDDVFADVGDEQSIEASLSTFSAHLKNLREILAQATDRSLVLTDELGSGTDPLEGAALGASILTALTRRGVRTVATTHLGALKQLALEVDGVVNGSLHFDEERLAPSYRFVKGIPGRSYGISIARRLGMPEEIVAAAEARIPTGERDAMVLLADLELRQARLDEAEREAQKLSARAQAQLRTASDRERAVREKERELERQARRESRQYLLEARAEVERVVRELRAAHAAAAEQTALEEAARAARQAVERRAAEEAQRLDILEAQAAAMRKGRGRPGAGAPAAAPAAAPTWRGAPLAAGDAVSVGTLGGKAGRIVEVRGKEAVVAVGALKLTVPMASLARRIEEAPKEKALAVFSDLPEVRVNPEIDLRGLRPDELDDQLLPALDNAVRADLKSLRIIHGKGTGVLRERVAELLRKDTRVREFRLGLWNEGGAGVTIATFE
jgi:DNA mismatch repair protein MutS2